MVEYIGVIIGSYLVGSIPSGLIMGKLRGVDIRQYGSGNIGTTNVLRTIGAKYGAIVLIADVLKGVIAIVLARYIIGTPVSEMAAGFAAVAGHDWSLFLKFKGGRGVATSLGGVLAMTMPAPLSAVAGVVVFVALLFSTRYVSLSSMSGSVAAVVAMAVLKGLDRVPWEYLIYIAVVVALIIFQHRDNIKRLSTGTEGKLGQKGERRQPG